MGGWCKGRGRWVGFDQGVGQRPEVLISLPSYPWWREALQT